MDVMLLMDVMIMMTEIDWKNRIDGPGICH